MINNLKDTPELEWIRKQRVERNIGLSSIAELAGCSTARVLYALKGDLYCEEVNDAIAILMGFESWDALMEAARQAME